MNRLVIAFLALAALGCTTPKAIVVEEPRKKPSSVASNSNASALTGPGIGLRDPDVLSELPEGGGLRSPASVTSATPDGSPTVIARPPGGTATDSPTTTGAN